MTIRRRNRQGAQRGTDHSGGYRLLCAVLASIQILLPTLAAALPTDGHVVAGQATIQQASPTTLSITQASDKAILNWNSFSIARNEAVHFIQPSVSSIALNRVIGVDPSVILGQLQSNGSIFLINPNGILFGAGAQINVGGLLATTLQIRDEDFMAGRYLFAQDPLKGLKTVVNRGTIHVSDNGYVVLVAPGVSNEGVIVANLGTTLLGSGQKFTLDLMGDGLIRYAINDNVLGRVTGPDGKPLTSAVSNSGSIQADGGHVILQAKATGDIFSSVVNQSGVIRARSLENHGGVVHLLGGDETLVAATSAGAMRPSGNVSGTVVNSGTIDVSAGTPNAAQGFVTMVGERVGQFGSIVATGAEGANGGEVVIASTTRTLLASGSTIDVSGSGHSSGGWLRVWSDQDTFFNGGATILARGGELGGNGGFIELSGKENLGYAGSVNALAPFGSAGTLLLDPRNITIRTAGGSAYNPGVNNLFGNTPATDVIITPASINAAAANVVLQANNDITVTNAIAMTNNGVGITMQAGRDILVNSGVSTTNGNISLTANDSGAIAANRAAGTGDIVFGAAGNLSAGSGNITLNVGPSAALPFNPGSITNVRNLTTTTGNITLNSPNTLSLSGAVNAGSGIVSINANSDGAGAQGFTMNAGNSIATTNTGTNAVQVIVNSPTGGTGAASLRGSITTGDGGTATVSTRGQAAVGGNTTGGAITQGAALNINTGATGNVALATGAATSDITFNTVGNDLTGTVGVSRARNITLRDANALDLGTVGISGNLTVTAGGAVTNSGNLSSSAAASTLTVTTLNNAGASITLDSIGNNFANINISARNAANSANAAGAITYRDVNAVNVTQLRTADTATLTTGGALTQSGAITVIGATTLMAGAGNNITLTNAGNNFTGSVSVITGGNVSLRDTNALVLGASTVSGALALTAGGALTQSGPLTVAGATSFTATAANTDILLGTQANNFTGPLSFAGTLGSFRDVSIRNVNAGATVPALAGLTSLRNLTLTYNNAPVALPALTLTAGGSLNISAGGAVTDSGNLIVPGTTTLVAGANNITLDNANNFTGAVSVISGNNVTLNDINALVLGPSTVSGTLNVTTAGALTQSGPLTVAGTTTLASSAANDITLTNAANNFSTVGITSGNSVSLTDANALVLGASTVSGNLALTTGGALSQTGALAVTGTTSFAATAANTDILLDTQTNNFGGALSFAGTQANFRDVQLRNVNAGAAVPALAGLTNLRNLTLIFDNAAMTLPTLTASGNLNLTAGGSINQSGLLAVGGTTTLATTVAGSDILLDTQANNLGSAVSFGGTLDNIRDVGLRNTNVGATIPSLAGVTSLRNLTLTFDNAPIALPSLTLTVGGNLNVTAGGSITETGTVTVPGATTLTTTVAGSDILLNTQANNFGGAIAFGGTQLNIRDLGLRNVNVGATVPALAGLTNLRNLTLTFDTAPMVLPNLTASGNLTATAGWLISQSGALTVAGNASFDTIAAATLGSVTLANGGALTLNTSTVGGHLTATTAAGDLTLPAGQTLTVVGDATLSSAGTVNLLGTTRIGGTQSSGGGTGSTFVLGADTNLNAFALPAAGDITVNTTGITASFAGAPLLPQAITLGNAGNSFGGPVSVTTAAPAFTGTTTNTYNLTQSAPVNLNVGQGLTVTDLGGTAGTRGNITLTNAGNSFNTVNFTGGNIVWQEANAVTIGGVSANAGITSSGVLSITAAGPLTQTGVITAAGTTILAAGTGNNITLTNAANNFSTVGITSGNNVALTDANALDLGASSIAGALNLTTNGALTQSGALTVAGATTLAAGAANDITLNNAVNNFSTVGITSGNDVSLVDSNALGFGASTVTGNLDVTTGGALTQSGALTVAGATTLVAGANDIILNSAGNNFSTMGVTSGNNVTLTDANALTITASTVSGNFSANANDLTVGGPVASTGGNLDLTGANTVTQLANLTTAGANTVTVTTAGGPITMAATATTTSGTGGINYTAGTDVTLGSLSTGGGVNVSANGGSVLSAAGSGTNVTAGTNSTLQAFNGVVGTSAAPITVTVNPGVLNIRTTSAVAGISAFLTGTVLPGNALTLLSVPPGLVCFNGCPVTSSPVSGPADSTFGYLNPDTIIPAYYPQPSRSVLISDITSMYILGTLLQPSPVSLSSDSPAVQSMGPKAKTGASCKQEEMAPNQQAAAASFDIRCAVQ